MESGAVRAMETFGMALATDGLKIVFGTDAVAGAHGQNAREAVARVEQGGQDPGAGRRRADLAGCRVAGTGG